jgi:hypothetical protein
MTKNGMGSQRELYSLVDVISSCETRSSSFSGRYFSTLQSKLNQSIPLMLMICLHVGSSREIYQGRLSLSPGNVCFPLPLLPLPARVGLLSMSMVAILREGSM